jgi:hypothetical protein
MPTFEDTFFEVWLGFNVSPSVRTLYCSLLFIYEAVVVDGHFHLFSIVIASRHIPVLSGQEGKMLSGCGAMASIECDRASSQFFRDESKAFTSQVELSTCLITRWPFFSRVRLSGMQMEVKRPCLSSSRGGNQTRTCGVLINAWILLLSAYCQLMFPIKCPSFSSLFSLKIKFLVLFIPIQILHRRIFCLNQYQDADRKTACCSILWG